LNTRDTLAGVSRELASTGIESARIEAEILVSAVLGLIDAPRVELLRAGDRELTTAEARTLASLVMRRLAGEPVQYIVRRAWFRDLTLEVGPGVLIPRPETEVLAGEVIQWVGKRPARVLDIGTGSGCIALAIAAECPAARVTAVDVSPEALDYAKKNRDRYPEIAPRVDIVSGEMAAGPFDVIVSNPPYIGESEAVALPREVREHEPAVALFAPGEGLGVIDRIISQGPKELVAGGLLALEVGHGQATAVVERMARACSYRAERIVADLAGRPRVVLAERR